MDETITHFVRWIDATGAQHSLPLEVSFGPIEESLEKAIVRLAGQVQPVGPIKVWQVRKGPIVFSPRWEMSGDPGPH